MKKTALCLALLLIVCLCAAGAEEAAKYEFESGTLHGGAQTARLGETGWVEGLTKEGDGVTVVIDAPSDGFYDLTVCQAGIGGYKENFLLVDGEAVGSTVAEGPAYAEHTLSHIYLAKGEHEVTVSSFWGYVKLDFLTVTPSSDLAEDFYDVAPTLSNPAPSAEAQALMEYLCSVYGEKMISGQYLDEYQYGAELNAVAGVTGGLYPAMVGLDLMNYSPASVSLGSWPTSVDQAIEYWRNGYLVTMCWHWIAPESYIDTTSNHWWGAYRAENTTLDLAAAMDGRDSKAYDLLIRDMDAIAEQLQRLRDAGVPVLWRPLHEASGGWFWWGAAGAEPYIALYRLMYDRFTNLHGLNNLIWVWNGQDAAWYPGDDVVDILGTDIYAGYHAHDSQSAAFLTLHGMTGAKKLLMLTECGCVPSPIKCARDGAMWSAFAVWCYEYVLNDGRYSETYTSADTLKLFYTQENVITRKDVPALGRATPQAEEIKQETDESGAIRVEFEDGTLHGHTRVVKAGPQTCVELASNDENDGVTVTVRVPASGEYDLVVIQSGIGGYKENYLSVDGERIGNTIVQGTDMEECVTERVYLTEGEHS
ncbi:MAG: hypothetical protein IJ174_03925, partial [Clostridia bacterium]|nr:hypothetical protein [Clostridia bacterium]